MKRLGAGLLVCALIAAAVWFLTRDDTPQRRGTDTSADAEAVVETAPHLAGRPTTAASRPKGPVRLETPDPPIRQEAIFEEGPDLVLWKGRVRGPGGVPIRNARVWLNPPRATEPDGSAGSYTESGSRGEWGLRAPPEPGDLCAWAPGYEILRHPGATPGNPDELRLVRAQRVPVSLSLPEELSEWGRGLVRVMVRIAPQRDDTPEEERLALSPPFEARRGLPQQSDLWFTLPRDTEGTLRVRVPFGWASKPQHVVWPQPGRSERVQFEIVRSGDLTITLVEAATGQRVVPALAGGLVHLRERDSGYRVISSEFDAKGSARLNTGLGPGTYEVELKLDLWRLSEVPFSLHVAEAGQKVRISVPVEPNPERGLLELALEGESQDAVNGKVHTPRRVYVRPEGEPWKLALNTGGLLGLGDVRFQRAPPGSYDVLMVDFMAGSVALARNVEVRGGQRSVAKLRLQKGHYFRPPESGRDQLRVEGDGLGPLPWLAASGSFGYADPQGYFAWPSGAFLGPYPTTELDFIERRPDGSRWRHRGEVVKTAATPRR